MKKPNIILALIPIIVLITCLVISVTLFGNDSTSGPSQIALLIGTAVSILISTIFLKVPYSKIESSMLNSLSSMGSAIFILLMIGALTSTWMLSGVVPTLIYYGLKMINPSIFLAIVFVFTAIISIMAGSSWTTIGTIGVAMMSAGSILGLHEGWLAGAIISGAYVGDKISPVSDTTNLSASVSGVDLYKHIRYLIITNIPIFILTLIIFLVVGFFFTPKAETVNVSQQMAELTSAYNISGWLLLVPCVTIALIIKKVSPFMTLFISSVIASVVIFFAQPHIIDQVCVGVEGGLNQFLYSSFKIISSGATIETGSAMMNELSDTAGMAGMLNTIYLILCVIAFGGAFQAGGFIEVITEKIMKVVKNAFGLVTSTVVTSILSNIILSDQYISILITGNMYKETYAKRGYAPELMSRSLQDSATVTSVLVPWNTCGIMQSTVLGVATFTYLPYCIFNLISPIVTIFVAAIGYKIRKIATK